MSKNIGNAWRPLVIAVITVIVLLCVVIVQRVILLNEPVKDIVVNSTPLNNVTEVTATPAVTLEPTITSFSTQNPNYFAINDEENFTETVEPTIPIVIVVTPVPNDDESFEIYTTTPTEVPTMMPTVEPTALPTAEPTVLPTVEPTALPTVEPTALPTVEPTALPTAEPTAMSTLEPTAIPTSVPDEEERFKLSNELATLTISGGIYPSYDLEPAYDLYQYISTDFIDDGYLWSILKQSFGDNIVRWLDMKFDMNRNGVDNLSYALNSSICEDCGRVKITDNASNINSIMTIFNQIDNSGEYGSGCNILLNYLYNYTRKNPDNQNERLFIACSGH